MRKDKKALIIEAAAMAAKASELLEEEAQSPILCDCQR